MGAGSSGIERSGYDVSGVSRPVRALRLEGPFVDIRNNNENLGPRRGREVRVATLRGVSGSRCFRAGRGASAAARRATRSGRLGRPPNERACSRPGGAGERGNERTLKETVSESKAARKRVTSVEPRDAGKWKGEEQNNGRQTNASARKGYAVAGAWPSAIDSESTERLADILVRSLVRPHLAEKPLTGKLDAGNPPVQFGGRGEVNPSSLPLSIPSPPLPLTRYWAGQPGARLAKWAG